MSTATHEGRIWRPRATTARTRDYAVTGTHPDGTERSIIPGTTDGDTPGTRRAAAIELTHFLNGVTGNDRTVFDAIHALSNDPDDYVRVRDIRATTGIATGTILAAVDRLEAVGYLRRPASAGGRRYIQLAEGWR